MTGLTTTGAKKIVRSTARDLIRACTPRASSRPIPFCATTIATVSSRVLSSDPRAASSCSSVMKLSRPMNDRSPMPLQSVKA